jgi:hypothetical protein
MSVGYHVSWLPSRLVTISVGYHVSWLPCQLVTMSVGYHVSWLPSQLVRKSIKVILWFKIDATRRRFYCLNLHLKDLWRQFSFDVLLEV